MPPPEPIGGPAAWTGDALRDDPSWQVELTAAHRDEAWAALDHFKAVTRARGWTTQWLHGHLTPSADDFPLPTLGPVLRGVQHQLEHGRGLALLRDAPTPDDPKDAHLLCAGLTAHVGTPRPQTVFGEKVQDIRNVGQAPIKERRGSKHDRPLPFHNDPADVVAFLCLQQAAHGGSGLFASAVAAHDALDPAHARTLYGDLHHAYQQYLFVRTGSNARWLPRARAYRMPTFTAVDGRFACKFSRFYVDEAQEFAEVPRLTDAQHAAIAAFEAHLADARSQVRVPYQPGDLVFVNNFVVLHARETFTDTADARRHLLRVWLSVPNSRPLSRHWRRQVFFRDVAAGAIRGGVPGPEVDLG